MIVVMMGVSGSGKTTLGTLLAKALRCEYLEGDLLHPAANREKMHKGIPLDDADREPWLEAVRAALLEAHRDGRDLVAGCSALKESYREYLMDGVPVQWVFLTGNPELIRARLEARTSHFMDPDLLDSQLATLEIPIDALQVDVADTPEQIVDRIYRALTASPEIRVSSSGAGNFAVAAGFVASFIRATVAERGRCLIAISGGETPGGLYERLADTGRYPIPWDAVHIFWCDERYVPPDDPRSNFRMARETLLDRVPCPDENIHPMPTTLQSPRAAADAYEDILRRFLTPDGGGLDLVLLGLGRDGHTASLFPDRPALRETHRWVVAVEAPVEPASRLTLTLPLLTRADCAAFLVSGGGKAEAVATALRGETEPVGAILRSAARVVWWLDSEAAGRIDR